MLVLGFVALAAAFAILLSSWRRDARMRLWRRAAHAAALTRIQERRTALEMWLEGRSKRLRVRLEGYRRGKHESGTRVTVRRLAGGELHLRREGLATAFGKRVLGEQEITTGDPIFDGAVYVQGRQTAVFALLDRETRGKLAQLLAGKLTLANGDVLPVRAAITERVLDVELASPGLFGAEDRLPEALVSLLAIAGRLVPPSDVPGRIAANLAREPHPRVRLNSLLTLKREFPEHAATQRALEAARQDFDDEVRLRAAMESGEAGRPTLVALASSQSADDSCSARAVAALADALPEAELEAILRTALSVGRVLTAIACLDLCCRHGRSAAEPILLEVLREPEPALSAAAARALGRTGTVAAVPALLELAESARAERRSAARQAVAEIQARLTGASPGQLSIADSGRGALSLSEGAAGGLSLADPPTLPVEADTSPLAPADAEADEPEPQTAASKPPPHGQRQPE